MRDSWVIELHYHAELRWVGVVREVRRVKDRVVNGCHVTWYVVRKLLAVCLVSHWDQTLLHHQVLELELVLEVKALLVVEIGVVVHVVGLGIVTLQRHGRHLLHVGVVRLTNIVIMHV